jgi:hypothetical protein
MIEMKLLVATLLSEYNVHEAHPMEEAEDVCVAGLVIRPAREVLLAVSPA